MTRSTTRTAAMFVVGFCLGTFVPLYTTLSRDCKQAHTCDCSDTAVITVTPTATSLDRNDLVGSPSGSFSSSRKVSVTEAATMATGADKSFVTTGAVPSRTIVTSKKHGGRDDNGDWHTIDVYVGNRTFFYQEPDGKKALESWSHLPIPVETNDATTSARMGAWYGQAEQDVLVASLLGYMSGGYYIDLASNEAFLDSNTFALDRFWGWKGLCIDANPQYWLALARLRTCQVLGAAVGGQSGTVSDPIVFKLKGGHGGLVHADFDNKKAENVDTRNTPSHIRDMGNLHVIPVPISDILRRYNVPTVIDYMSLDVEGAESYVMKDFPFDSYDIKILTGERLKRDLRDLLAAKGYSFMGYVRDWGEGLWINSKYVSSMNLTAIPPLAEYDPKD